MAELKGNVLGKITGTIGNLVGRVRSGKNYLASRPGSFLPGDDPGSVARRERFKLSVQFAKSLIQLGDLKFVWDDNSPSGISAYNFIVQSNYKFFENDLPSSSNIIVPPNGFSISTNQFQLSPTALHVELLLLGDSAPFDPAVEKNLRLYSLFSLYEPLNPDFDAYGFIPLFSGKQVFQTSADTIFDIPIPQYHQSLIAKYQNKKVFIALLTLDENDKPVRYSITLSE